MRRHCPGCNQEGHNIPTPNSPHNADSGGVATRAMAMLTVQATSLYTYAPSTQRLTGRRSTGDFQAHSKNQTGAAVALSAISIAPRHNLSPTLALPFRMLGKRPLAVTMTAGTGAGLRPGAMQRSSGGPHLPVFGQRLPRRVCQLVLQRRRRGGRAVHGVEVAVHSAAAESQVLLLVRRQDGVHAMDLLHWKVDLWAKQAHARCEVDVRQAGGRFGYDPGESARGGRGFSVGPCSGFWNETR